MEHEGVFSDLDEAGRQLDSPVVTIGNFDGVHIGHQAIFGRANTCAEEADVPSLALTFSPHPVRFFKPDADEFRLTTDAQKFRLIRQHDIDAVLALPFDRSVAELEPDAFVDRILDRGLDASRVIVGANFAFGKNRAGSTEDLERLCRNRDIAADICEKVEYGGEVVSSTRIREALGDGKVAAAADLLGRNHRVAGTVVEGEGRGRDLGYPTANIAPQNLVPADGIYATYLHIPDEGPLPSASSLGTRPTFEVGNRTTECFVLEGKDWDLYDQDVELEFVEYIRPERAFDEVDELVEQ
ncbi:MAG: bifunctional riboflavin kinase/FAD synthetase, partial [Bradymonadaceae bacterium]